MAVVSGFRDAPTNPFTATTRLGARDYSPALGRFLTVDPVLDTANPQPDNGYAYALNNPATQADPSGLCVHADGLSCGATCGGTCGPPAPAPAPSFGSSNSAEHYNNGYTGNITLSFGGSNSAEHYSHGYTRKLPPSKPKPANKPKSSGCHGSCAC